MYHVTSVGLPVTVVLCLLYLVPTGDAHLLCPPIIEGVVEDTTCDTQCQEDSQCQSGGRNHTLCCPTSSCGQQCVTALEAPYHPPVLQCPQLDPDTAGSCNEECGGDTGECEGDQLCCSNGCGHVCTDGEPTTPICQAILDSRNGTIRPGEYVPQCSESGRFNQVQCHASTGYCWCVRPDTGVPVGRNSTLRSQPECKTCFHYGALYYPGDTFNDDCNTCFCSEYGVSCTEMACIPPTPTFYSCPVLEDDTVGICSEECSSDEDCNSDQKCCSNGCGHTCMDPVPIPYIAVQRECPEEYEYEWCDIHECTNVCEDPQKICCQNNCGSNVCVEGELPPYPCNRTVNSLTGATLLGEFIPRCNEVDGTFQPLQCSSHYCWCVDEQTGEPTSDMREIGDMGDLECANPPDLSSTPTFYSCPVLEDDAVGICSEECSSDEDCNSGQKCCSNGCGHTCMDPVPIPYIAVQRECPEEYEYEWCDIHECTDSCDDPQKLCCENDCKSTVCVEGELPPYPCTKTVNSLTGATLLGEFIPRCNEVDGTFWPLQCSSHYCWCVDEQTGEPTSDMRESRDVGQLECSRCIEGDRVFDHGDVVETRGPCEKSTCRGGELVWIEDCDNKSCEHKGKMYENGQTLDDDCACVCLEGAIACADSTTPCFSHCVHRGVYYIPGDTFPEGDGCNSCFCSDSYMVACTEVACEDEEESNDDLYVESDDELEWWHAFLIGAGTLIAVLVIVATGLLVVMVMIIRSGQFRHKRLHDNTETISLEGDSQILFKNGPPEGESVELKVPVEGDDNPDPIKT